VEDKSGIIFGLANNDNEVKSLGLDYIKTHVVGISMAHSQFKYKCETIVNSDIQINDLIEVKVSGKAVEF